jgi:hypothetical protein
LKRTDVIRLFGIQKTRFQLNQIATQFDLTAGFVASLQPTLALGGTFLAEPATILHLKY